MHGGLYTRGKYACNGGHHRLQVLAFQENLRSFSFIIAHRVSFPIVDYTEIDLNWLFSKLYLPNHMPCTLNVVKCCLNRWCNKTYFCRHVLHFSTNYRNQPASISRKIQYLVRFILPHLHCSKFVLWVKGVDAGFWYLSNEKIPRLGSFSKWWKIMKESRLKAKKIKDQTLVKKIILCFQTAVRPAVTQTHDTAVMQ